MCGCQAPLQQLGIKLRRAHAWAWQQQRRRWQQPRSNSQPGVQPRVQSHVAQLSWGGSGSGRNSFSGIGSAHWQAFSCQRRTLVPGAPTCTVARPNDRHWPLEGLQGLDGLAQPECRQLDGLAHGCLALQKGGGRGGQGLTPLLSLSAAAQRSRPHLQKEGCCAVGAPLKARAAACAGLLLCACCQGGQPTCSTVPVSTVPCPLREKQWSTANRKLPSQLRGASGTRRSSSAFSWSMP